MRKVRWAAVILLACWLPATSQCLLEKAAVVAAADNCCPGSPEDSAGKEFGGACCDLAQGQYKPAPAETACLVPDFTGPDQNPGREIEGDTFVAEFSVTFSTTGLESSWQFIQRAAAAPRAPSIAS